MNGIVSSKVAVFLASAVAISQQGSTPTIVGVNASAATEKKQHAFRGAVKAVDVSSADFWENLRNLNSELRPAEKPKPSAVKDNSMSKEDFWNRGYDSLKKNELYGSIQRQTDGTIFLSPEFYDQFSQLHGTNEEFLPETTDEENSAATSQDEAPVPSPVEESTAKGEEENTPVVAPDMGLRLSTLTSLVHALVEKPEFAENAKKFAEENANKFAKDPRESTVVSNNARVVAQKMLQNQQNNWAPFVLRTLLNAQPEMGFKLPQSIVSRRRFPATILKQVGQKAGMKKVSGEMSKLA